MKKTKTKNPVKVIERLAADFGKSLRTAKEWVRTGCPVTPRYERAKVQAWLKQRRQKTDDESPEAERKWITEFRKFKAKRQKLDYLKEMGKLVEREVMEKKMHNLAENFKGVMDRVPRVAATEIYRLTGNTDHAYDVEAAVARHIEAFLWEVYHSLKGKKDENSGERDRNSKTDQAKTENEKISEAQSGREEITATGTAEKCQPDPGQGRYRTDAEGACLSELADRNELNKPVLNSQANADERSGGTDRNDSRGGQGPVGGSALLPSL